jgi:hypothetical protein
MIFIENKLLNPNKKNQFPANNFVQYCCGVLKKNFVGFWSLSPVLVRVLQLSRWQFLDKNSAQR